MKNGAWPKDDDLWLKAFLEDPAKNLLPCGPTPLLDHKWWELLSVACHGIDESFLAAHFPNMAVWLHENKDRNPKTPRGWKAFVRHWLLVEAAAAAWKTGTPSPRELFAASRVSQQSRRDYKDK